MLVPEEALRRAGREEEREAQRIRAAPRDEVAGIDRVTQPPPRDRRVLADDAVGQRRGDRLRLVEEAEVAELVEQRGDQPAVEHAVEVLLAEDLPRDRQPAFELAACSNGDPRGGPAGSSSCHAASNRGSSVSVSRRAGPPQAGHSHATKSARPASVSPAFRPAGSRTGRRSCGTGTAPHGGAADDGNRRAPRSRPRDRQIEAR